MTDMSELTPPPVPSDFFVTSNDIIMKGKRNENCLFSLMQIRVKNRNYFQNENRITGRTKIKTDKQK